MQIQTTRTTADVPVRHGIEDATIVSSARASTSWGAIWAGFFVGLSTELILTVLMAGIFGTTFFTSGGTASGGGFGIGIALWIFCESLVAYFAAGWTAGRLSQNVDTVARGLHGAAVWGLMTAALLYMTSGIALRGAFGAARAGASVSGAPAMQLAGWVLIYFVAVFIASFAAAYAGGRSAKTAP